MLKRTFKILFFLGTLITACQAQSRISEEVRNNIKTRVDDGTNPGIVVGVIDTDGTHFFSYGVKSLKDQSAVDENSVFEIGSITKTFTGIILADMALKKKLNLEDPLQKYLPEGVNAPTLNGQHITLKHLANHTSSLPRIPSNFKPVNMLNPYANYSEENLYEFLNNYTLTRDIGSKYEYSNLAMGLLGHILANKQSTTYESLMVETIAKPLGLYNTRVTFTPDMKKHLAMGHSGGVEVENWDLPTLAGAGAIRSTAVDMLKYLSANMGKEKSVLYPAMQLSQKNSRAEDKVPVVGLGWHVMTLEDKDITWHNGGTGGYTVFIGFIENEKKGVVVLTNSNMSVDDIGKHLLQPEFPLFSYQVVAVDEAILEGYVGKYELNPGFVITISKDGSQLLAQATDQQEIPIFPKSENIFFSKVVKGELSFKKLEDGTVESVTLHQWGKEMVGKKVE